MIKNAQAYCKRCGEELHNAGYVYAGETVCKKCYEEAHSLETIVEYVKAYPNRFIEYLTEMAIIQEAEGTVEMLVDYREWQDELYDEWVLS